MDTSLMIHASELTKTYLATKALDRFSLRIGCGESVALLGANGAGKSTFIRIVLGLEVPDSPPEGGTANLMGASCTLITPRIRERVGYISDDAGPIPWASARDLAGFYQSLYPRWDWAVFHSYLERWSLPDTQKLKELSKGQRRLTEFALVLSYHPDVLVLDEPFNGLDAVNRIDLVGMLNTMRKSDAVTLLYTTHVLEEVGKLADRVVVIRNGASAFDAPLAGLTESVEAIFKRCYGV